MDSVQNSHFHKPMLLPSKPKNPVISISSCRKEFCNIGAHPVDYYLQLILILPSSNSFGWPSFRIRKRSIPYSLFKHLILQISNDLLPLPEVIFMTGWRMCPYNQKQLLTFNHLCHPSLYLFLSWFLSFYDY